MRTTWSVLVSLVALFALAAGLRADEATEGKEVTLKGKITCAKCELMVEGQKGCATVIVEKKEGKEVVYYFDKKSHAKHHGKICKQGMEGSVTGTVSKMGEKKVITATKVQFEDK